MLLRPEDFVEFAGAVAEFFGFDAEGVEHGDVHVREADFVFVEFAEMTVGETHVFAAGEDEGIVAGEVGSAGGAAVHDEGIVEDTALPFRLVAELLEEVGKVLVHELIPESPVFPAGFAAVAEGVVGVEAEGFGEAVGLGAAAFDAEHVGDDPGGVGAEGVEHEVVEGTDVVLHLGTGGVHAEGGLVNFGLGLFEPAFEALDALFVLADGVEVIVEGAAVGGVEVELEGSGVLKDAVEHALADKEFAAGAFEAALFLAEHEVEATADIAFGGNGLAGLGEREGVGATEGAYTAAYGEGQEWEAGFSAVLFSDDLVEGNGVLVGVGVYRAGGEEDVGDAVAGHAASGRVGQAGEEGDVVAERFEGLGGLVEFEVLAFAFGEPVPISAFGVIGRREGDAVGEEHTGDAFGCRCCGLGGVSGTHGFEEWKAEGDSANAPKDLAAGKVPGFFHE